MHIQVELISYLACKCLCRQKRICCSAPLYHLLYEKWEQTDPKSLKIHQHYTYFSWGELPIAGLSWLGFCGGWGFCCSGGRPPGPPWPWAAGRGCCVVGAPGRPGWPEPLCCWDPPCDCCLMGWAGLCGWDWPVGGFWPGPPADDFCWVTDCCLWVPGEPPWPRWGDVFWPWEAPWPGGRDWAGPWVALTGVGSLVAELAVDCCGCAGGWPWGCGRGWDGGLCWGPPTGENGGSHGLLIWI